MESGKLKNAIVTGADGGIGTQFCKALAERKDWRIVLVGIREEELRRTAEDIAEKYGVETYPLNLDLTRPDCAETLLAFLDEHGLEPDLLINNAGVFSFCPLAETPQGKIRTFIDLHVRAVTDLSIAVGRRMARRGSGHILNMSSMSCWMPMPGIALYSATKAYIRVISRALHYELRDSGVRVTVACPGGIATDLFGLSKPLQKFAVAIGVLDTPERFARKAVKKALKGRKQYINGGLNRFSIFFVSILPTPVRMLVKRKMLDRGIRR